MALSAIRNRASRKLSRPLAIAVLNEPDFYRFTSQRSAHRLPDRYQDWLDEREGLLVGLSAAGVRTIRIAVDLDKFLAWCATESIAANETALDRFAASIQGAMTISHGDFALPADRGYGHVVQPRFGGFN